ncbi:hypothetical protein D3C87_1993600 [compost metagenome]
MADAWQSTNEHDFFGQRARLHRDAGMYIRRIEIITFEEGVRSQFAHAVQACSLAMRAGRVDRVQQVSTVEVVVHRSWLGNALQVVVK